MGTLQVHLFGKFRVELDGQLLPHLHTQKAQELFCYLLLRRDRAHLRESLASLQWNDKSTVQSKKYLRQALWQLQAALEAGGIPPAVPLLLLDADWVQVNPEADLWLDVTVLEQAYSGVHEVSGWQMDAESAARVQAAVQLYHGDLLEGWYQDWCLFERERLQSIYLALLDKLMDYCEAHHDYAAGLAHGTSILRFDRARERTHRRLMRLHYLSGNRTKALRQYELCVAALQEELGVKPARRTEALYQQIRDDRLASPGSTALQTPPPPETPTTTLQEVLERLRQLQTALSSAQSQVQQDIQAVEVALRAGR